MEFGQVVVATQGATVEKYLRNGAATTSLDHFFFTILVVSHVELFVADPLRAEKGLGFGAVGAPIFAVNFEFHDVLH